MTTTVPVKPELIRWAIERSGLSEDDLGKFPIEQWEAGVRLPTMKQLEEFAKRTMTPFGYLFLPTPPIETLPVPDYRTVKDAPVRRASPNLLETLHLMQRRQKWMRDYLIDEGQEPLSFVGSAKLSQQPNAVAAKIRQVLGVSSKWAAQQATWTDALRAMREIIEEIGILVVTNGIVGNNTHRKLDPDEFRGFVLSDEYAPLIFVNGADAKSAQMFTLAHELAHVWLGRGGVFNLPNLQPVDNDLEKFCNQVAAEFLVPEVELRASWREAKNSGTPFESLARQFKVSAIVAARRALDLSLISKGAFFAFYESHQAVERQKAADKSGGDFYRTQNVRVGKRFATTVIRAAKEGKLLYRDAYALLDLYGSTFDKYARSLGERLP